MAGGIGVFDSRLETLILMIGFENLEHSLLIICFCITDNV